MWQQGSRAATSTPVTTDAAWDGESTISDAVLNRLVPSAHRLDLKGGVPAQGACGEDLAQSYRDKRAILETRVRALLGRRIGLQTFWSRVSEKRTSVSPPARHVMATLRTFHYQTVARRGVRSQNTRRVVQFNAIRLMRPRQL
jgi:hypothetical protein